MAAKMVYRSVEELADLSADWTVVYLAAQMGERSVVRLAVKTAWPPVDCSAETWELQRAEGTAAWWAVSSELKSARLLAASMAE